MGYTPIGLLARGGTAVVDLAVAADGRHVARKRIVLADATKIGRVTLAQVCRMAEVDVLITDCRATQAQLEALRRQGAAVACV